MPHQYRGPRSRPTALYLRHLVLALLILQLLRHRLRRPPETQPIVRAASKKSSKFRSSAPRNGSFVSKDGRSASINGRGP
eukprot:560799-Rhodomonas_salina.1